MFEFTSNPKGLEGVLAELPREPLCKIDDTVVTIPKEFPASVGLAYVAVQQRYGDGAALIWGLQTALGAEAVDLLLNVGLTDEQFTTITAIVVARMQGEPVSIPTEDKPAPKARAPRQRRASSSKK